MDSMPSIQILNFGREKLKIESTLVKTLAYIPGVEWL